MDKANDDLRLLFFILQLLLIDPHTFIAHKSSYIAACSYALVRHLKQYEVYVVSYFLLVIRYILTLFLEHGLVA